MEGQGNSVDPSMTAATQPQPASPAPDCASVQDIIQFLYGEDGMDGLWIEDWVDMAEQYPYGQQSVKRRWGAPLNHPKRCASVAKKKDPQNRVINGGTTERSQAPLGVHESWINHCLHNCASQNWGMIQLAIKSSMIHHPLVNHHQP